MKIVIDINPLKQKNLSGIGKYLQETLSRLLVLDKNNQYFLFSYGRKNKDIKVDLPVKSNVNYIHFNIPSKFIFILSFLNLFFLDFWKKKDKKIKADIVWMPNLGPGNLKFKRTKLITTIHDLSFKTYPQFFNWKRRLWHWLVNPQKIIRRSNKIIAVSENTSLDLQKNYQVPRDKIKIISLGIDKKYKVLDIENLRDIKSKYHLNKDFVFFLGTKEPRKNILSIIKAFSKLKQENLELIIVGGKGWKKRIWKDHYDDLEESIKSRIRIIDYVPERDLPALYNLAKVFVWPSFYEGFGLPPLEAMACGCPVITSNNSSLPAIVQNKALLIEAFNIQSLYLALKNILEDEKLYLFYKNQKFDLDYYSNWDKSAEKLLKLFDKLCG